MCFGQWSVRNKTNKLEFPYRKIPKQYRGIGVIVWREEMTIKAFSIYYEGCSKSFANRYTENTQSIGI